MPEGQDCSVSGRCQCGAVRFTVQNPPTEAGACHCTICRRTQGNYAIDILPPRDSVAIEGEETLRWYRSSEICQRSFCSVCGSSLFAQYEDGLFVVSVGALDEPTGIRLTEHIFVADKGDYYDITDGLPQHQGRPPQQDEDPS